MDDQLAAVWHVLNEPGFEPPQPGAVRVVRCRNAANDTKAGAKVSDLDDATLAKWQTIAKPVWKDFADKNENCAKLLALAQKVL